MSCKNVEVAWIWLKCSADFPFLMELLASFMSTIMEMTSGRTIKFGCFSTMEYMWPAHVELALNKARGCVIFEMIFPIIDISAQKAIYFEELLLLFLLFFKVRLLSQKFLIVIFTTCNVLGFVAFSGFWGWARSRMDRNPKKSRSFDFRTWGRFDSPQWEVFAYRVEQSQDIFANDTFSLNNISRWCGQLVYHTPFPCWDQTPGLHHMRQSKENKTLMHHATNRICWLYTHSGKIFKALDVGQIALSFMWKVSMPPWAEWCAFGFLKSFIAAVHACKYTKWDSIRFNLLYLVLWILQPLTKVRNGN